MENILYLDFEFNNVREEFLNLVCCTTFNPMKNEVKEFWLHKDERAQRDLLKFLKTYKTLASWSVVAEARCIYSLKGNPLDFNWVDLFLEYRMACNNNDNLSFGMQLVDGKPKMTRKPRPKWEKSGDLEDLEEEGSGFKQTFSLAEATYKLTGEIRDTDHKTKMRDLIISSPAIFTEEESAAIQKYCTEDVIYLPKIFEEIESEIECLDKNFDEDIYFKEALGRGKYAAITAIMESKGYPIDYEKVKNFSSSTLEIIYECQADINSQFPDILPFKWDWKENRFSWDQIKTKEWISKNHTVSEWRKTEKGEISLSLEAFSDFYNFQHDYPRNNFGAQMVRFLKLKQSLYGFVPSKGSGKKKKKSFWDYVGSDNRVRPYMGIFVAQSSRSQPSSTGFMFLKPAWMRALVVPEKGKAMAGIDYGSEEFFISALRSEDRAMIEAYLSGDVYLAFGKQAGMIPESGTKEEFKEERNLSKSTVLGLSFLMTKIGLSRKLTADTGVTWDEDQAQDLINTFYDTYPGLYDWQQEIIKDFEQGEIIKLPCGFYMFGDSSNFRSYVNCPVQGFGGSVMRKAVELAFERGLYVCFTLHDALYIEYNIGEEYKIEILRDCMKEAFAFYFEPHLRETALKIKLDPFAWSRDYKPNSKLKLKTMEVDCSNLYIDERAMEDYKKFSKYFLNRGLSLL